MITIAAMALCALTASAQQAVGTFTVKPLAGINIANITGGDGKDIVGLAAGAEFEYQAGEIFSISAGAIYSQQGSKSSKIVEGVGVDYKANLDYLNIPVLANVYVAPGLAVKLGVQPSFKLKAKQKAEALGQKLDADLDDIKSFDFSIPVGLSYEYKNVVLDGRYNWGLIDTMKGYDGKNSVVQITLGYKFAL